MSTTEERAMEAADETVQQRRRFVPYMVTVLLVFPILYVLPVILLRSPSIARHVVTLYGQQLAVPFELQNDNADVVVFGDSTALYGVDPHIVQQQLGVNLVILPNTASSLPVLDDKALQVYLAHNHKPHLLVLYFTAWNLDYRHHPLLGPNLAFEGEEILFRFGTWQEIFQFFRGHKWQMIQFPIQMFYTGVRPSLTELIDGTSAAQTALDSRGHLTAAPTIPLMQCSCTLPEKFLKSTTNQSVKELQDKYGPQIPTFVYLAPVPSCTNADVPTGRSYADLGAASPVTMPSHVFLQDTLYAHPGPGGINEATADFIQVLRTHLPAKQ